MASYYKDLLDIKKERERNKKTRKQVRKLGEGQKCAFEKY